MFVIFGWRKTRESLGVVGRGFCCHCRQQRGWIIGKETEWVALYLVNVLPFATRHHFVCERCDDDVRLDRHEFAAVKRQMQAQGSIDGSEVHRQLFGRVRSQQLAGKTPLQRQWIEQSEAADAQRRAEAAPAAADRMEKHADGR